MHPCIFTKYATERNGYLLVYQRVCTSHNVNYFPKLFYCMNSTKRILVQTNVTRRMILFCFSFSHLYRTPVRSATHEFPNDFLIIIIYSILWYDTGKWENGSLRPNNVDSYNHKYIKQPDIKHSIVINWNNTDGLLGLNKCNNLLWLAAKKAV